LTVTIEPSGAVTADAQWSLDGSTWKDSGTSETLEVGTSYTITFKSATGYDSPANATGTIASGSNPITGTYTEQTSTCDYSLNDVITILQILTGSTDSVNWKDTDNDGYATLKDALYILRCLTG